MGGWRRWAQVSPDGVAHSQMVSVSASVNLPLHHKDQKFSSGIGSPRWSHKNGRKTVVVVVLLLGLLLPFYDHYRITVLRIGGFVEAVLLHAITDGN